MGQDPRAALVGDHHEVDVAIAVDIARGHAMGHVVDLRQMGGADIGVSVRAGQDQHSFARPETGGRHTHVPRRTRSPKARRR